MNNRRAPPLLLLEFVLWKGVLARAPAEACASMPAQSPRYAHSATKAGLIGMIKVMGKEYAESRLTVNGLAPAVIQTPLVENMPEVQVFYMTNKIPMNRLDTLDEAAAMATWIISPECSFTTGFTFDLSGGRAVY